MAKSMQIFMEREDRCTVLNCEGWGEVLPISSGGGAWDGAGDICHDASGLVLSLETEPSNLSALRGTGPRTTESTPEL